MVLSWFGSGGKGASVTDLIARRKYDKALELLREQFKQGSRDPRLRLQMADVLVLSGRGKEAVPILVGLADEYASDGFAAKAIALFKKIDKIDPGRKDVETKLAGLIQEPSRAVPLRPRARTSEEAGEIDLGFAAPVSAAAAAAPAPETPAAPADGAAAPAVEMWEEEEEDVALSEDAFREQLLDLVQDSLATPAAATGNDAAPPAEGAKSPLFGDFAEDELMAVMEGLNLLLFEPGDVIITEGEPGDSLFVLSTGVVKAWVRNPQGRHVQVRQMEEGSFFGEISILTGKPRTATVTAATACELLELDRRTLDEIATRHPRVMQVLEEFHRQRADNAAEAQIRSGKG